jgi:ABC-type multidrug transport system ATPase subunit/predicted component of type VI protein secretion system
MKIILAEEREGKQLSELSFNQRFIRIGRDTADCQVVFDNEQSPMVSHRHCELRWQNGKWVLHDLNSSHGTFIDGQKVTAPQTVKIGSELQFGLNGPVLRVVRFEVEDYSLQKSAANPSRNKSLQNPVRVEQDKFSVSFDLFSAPSPNIPKQINQSQSPDSQIATLEFISGHSAAIPYKIIKDSIWLGRDLNGDIVFQAFAGMVSRRHAEISRQNDDFTIHDNGSFNGTLVNGQLISAPTPLYHNDKIQLGLGGPVLRFNAPWRVAPKGANLAGQRLIAAGQMADLNEQIGSQTIVVKAASMSRNNSGNHSAQPQHFMSLTFGSKKELSIGRAETSDIKLDGLLISNRHARLLQTNSGIVIEDFNSTNGVYINGSRIFRQLISPNDAAQIGSFLIKIDQAGRIDIFDTRSKTRIDLVKITKEVKNRSGSGLIRLLDNVSLSIKPNEFVGLLGPSGAGKSTLMVAMNGVRPASSGSVLINNLDLYQHLDSLKQSIGYVPQDDIIHRELSVYRTLYYVAKLRLSSDVSSSEIKQIVDEVLDVTGLSERRDISINRLSGGQRKRVSIAVELITKPSVIFLDEPTSGLDPATEEKIMKLFRQIAESGRTIILTTHAMENVKFFDKIVVLMRGKLAFYGKPEEALRHLNASSFKDLYDKLEEPIEQKMKLSGNGYRHQFSEQVAEDWKKKFIQTPQYQKNVYQPLKEIGKVQSHNIRKTNRLGLLGSIRQWLTLSRRYAEVLLRDKLNLFILFVQAPIIAFLTYFVMGKNQPRDFIYFILSLVAVWFGTSVAVREIIRERPVYKRERMVNLGLVPYLFSKLFVLGFIVSVQCLLLFLPLKLLDISGLMPMPGEMFGIPQFWAMLLTAAVGVALGLLISALVRTSELATSLVPLILIPQILFSGLIGLPSGINKAAGLIMPTTWSFDTMKRFSTLDTLENEGAEFNGKTKGQGLYRYIETENDKIIADAKRKMDEYKYDSEKKLDDFKAKLNSGKNPAAPQLDEPPTIVDAKKLPENLSEYITFLHPWMDEVLNQIVLMIMFCLLVIATLIGLRMQDIG